MARAAFLCLEANRTQIEASRSTTRLKRGIKNVQSLAKVFGVNYSTLHAQLKNNNNNCNLVTKCAYLFFLNNKHSEQAKQDYI